MASRKDPSYLQCFRCQGWGHMAWECPTPAKTLNQSGGSEGMWPNPPPVPATTANSRPPVSLPKPRPKLTTMKAAQRTGWPEVAPFPFLDPGPIACLVGCSNETPVIVDGQRMGTLIDLDAQVSSISSQFCEDFALQIQPLVSYLN